MDSLKNVGIGNVGKRIVEGAGGLFNFVVEVGKASPRVVTGLVISGGMKVVSATGSDDKGSPVGSMMAFVGMGILGFGGLLWIMGICGGGCPQGSDRTDEGRGCAKTLVGVGMIIVVIGLLDMLISIGVVVAGE